jgi:hypothetical protein
MRCLAPIPAPALKRLLELDGFTVEDEDNCNWALAKDGVEDVLTVPKLGRFVASEIVSRVFGAIPSGGPRHLFTRAGILLLSSTTEHRP